MSVFCTNRRRKFIFDSQWFLLLFVLESFSYMATFLIILNISSLKHERKFFKKSTIPPKISRSCFFLPQISSLFFWFLSLLVFMARFEEFLKGMANVHGSVSGVEFSSKDFPPLSSKPSSPSPSAAASSPAVASANPQDSGSTVLQVPSMDAASPLHGSKSTWSSLFHSSEGQNFNFISRLLLMVRILFSSPNLCMIKVLRFGPIVGWPISWWFPSPFPTSRYCASDLGSEG